MTQGYLDPVCRGSYVLGTHCGRCERCEEERLKHLKLNQPGADLARLRQAIIDNTKGDLFWIGEILLAELAKETGFSGDARTHS